jgi:Uma2 family endonuclease
MNGPPPIASAGATTSNRLCYTHLSNALDMPASTQISLDEYLNTVYRPDREYLDGELIEKNMGKWEHSRIQLVLGAWFFQHEQQWQISAATEWRTRTAADTVRIPDVVVVLQGPQPDVLDTPPLLVVEILSPGDSYADTQRRAQDYLAMGVQTIWIIDPETRTARQCTGPAWIQTTRLEVPGTPVYADVESLFAALDRNG